MSAITNNKMMKLLNIKLKKYSGSARPDVAAIRNQIKFYLQNKNKYTGTTKPDVAAIRNQIKF